MPADLRRLLLGETWIPTVGFGTYLIAPEDAAQAVSDAIAAGYRHIDTAAAYRNEAEVGAGIQEGLRRAGIAREELFVTGKLWPGNADWGDAPKGYDATHAAFESSCSALGLETLDLYLIHAPSGGAERISEWRALVDLKSRGRTRTIGVSNYTEAHIEEIRAAGLPLPQANQLELHPWSQKPALVAFLKAEGILPIAYSSLVPLSTWRVEPGQASAKTEAMKADGADDTSPIKSVATRHGVSEAQVLLRWGVQQGYPVLPKSLKPERMRQNLDVFSFALDTDDLDRLARLDKGDGVAWASGDPRNLG
jgi:2,5-diketo-D-gluconate reductase A